MTRLKDAIARRPFVIVLTVATLGVAALGSISVAAKPGTEARGGEAGESCEGADLPAADVTVQNLRRSVRCLINLERAVHGRSALQRDRRLQSAGQKHAATMAANDCLAHRCGDEPALAERIARAGYLTEAEAWQYAESTGCGESAEAMVSNWMASRFHRINILEKTYDDLGVGVVQEPVRSRCDKDYATFGVVFAWRTPEA